MLLHFLLTMKTTSIGFLHEHKFSAVTIRSIFSTVHWLPMESTSLSINFFKSFSALKKIPFQFECFSLRD